MQTAQDRIGNHYSHLKVWYYANGTAVYCNGVDFSVIFLVTGFEPSLRLAAHTVIHHNNVLYIYGGYSQAHRRLVNQIIIL